MLPDPSAERVHENFDPARLENARRLTWQAIERVSKTIEPGILESQAREKAEVILKEMGAGRLWHKTHIRFGVNTLKTFSEDSLPGVRLQADDIFFFDFGPVWDGYEGDAGASFTVGGDEEMVRCAADAKKVFGLVRNRWIETKESGKQLYTYAQRTAEDLGWDFNLRGASGHRISDFPHRLYHRGSMESADFHPSASRWILEVQLRHPSRRFGAFYEDVLV